MRRAEQTELGDCRSPRPSESPRAALGTCADYRIATKAGGDTTASRGTQISAKTWPSCTHGPEPRDAAQELLAREDPGRFHRECPEKRELLLRQMQRLPVKAHPATEGIEFAVARRASVPLLDDTGFGRQRDDPDVQLRIAERFPNRI